MLDYLAIFTKGGALLWAWQLGQLKGDPVGALIRSCLLEDRAGEKAFAYVLPGGGGYTVKWSLHNVSTKCPFSIALPGATAQFLPRAQLLSILPSRPWPGNRLKLQLMGC